MQGLELVNHAERRNPLKGDFDFRAANLEKWIEELPRGSVGETGQLLHEKLIELNSLNIKFQERMNCLELFREPVQYVTDSIKKHFIYTTFPISQRVWRSAVACRSIHAALANGYKIAAHDISHANILFYDKKLLVTAIHRAVSYIEQILLNCYQVYEAYLFDYWKDLNSLYAYAEEKDLHETLTVDKMHQHSKKTTIRDEYVRALLLFMTDPDHLRQGEVSKIHVNLERWISYVKLYPLEGNSQDSVAAKTVVNLSSEFPPRVLRALPEEDDINTLRCIDVSKLLPVIQDELKKSDKNVSNTLVGLELESEILPANLVNRIIESWSGAKKRRFNRQRINQKVRLSIGLSNIHQLLKSNIEVASKQSPLTNEVSDNNKFCSSATYDVSDIEDENTLDPDVWDMVYPTTKQDFNYQNEKEHPKIEGSSSKDLFTSDSWRMINQSPEGFCLTCIENCGENIQVGELIGINVKEDATSGWSSVAMVRWIRSYGENGTVLGGAMLSPNTVAVGIKTFSENHNESELQRALYFSEIDALERPASLVLPSLASRAGQLLKLHIPGKKDRQVKLTRLLGSNHLVSQFLFVPMGEGKTKVSETLEKNEPNKKSDFDDVWKVL